jgi:epoxyqueuosine reductase QueG
MTISKENEPNISLEEEIIQFLKDRGAIRVGFANKETLAGPPHVDITYKLPDAKSAISYALLFDKDMIRQFLNKESFANHEENRFDLNYRSVKISKELASWLKDKGYDAKHVISNNNYKKEIKGWQRTMPPKLSHRYVAVASGVGSFGWSGNVGIKGIGTTILLGTVVTIAELKPTEPLPPEESFCTKCKLCANVCVAQTFSKDEEITFTLGGHQYSHAKRNGYVRCQYVCGGFTGLHPSKQWSTWSPGRFPVPKTNDEILKMLGKAIKRYPTWPERADREGGYENFSAPGLNIRLTCGMCQNICWGNTKDTAENYKLLSNSGCIVQNEDGSFEVLPPEEAEQYFQSLPKKHRSKYCIES